jgi:hypothetical protein
MSFKDDNPNWKLYSNSVRNMNTVPSMAFAELKGLIRKSSNDNRGLKDVLNGFAEIIPCEPTQNWGWNFLENDIAIYVDALKAKVNKGKFPVFMDCLAVLIDVGDLRLEDINEFLEDNNIGYCAEYNFNHQVIWRSIEESDVVEHLEEAQATLSSVSKQACDEIRRARKSLEDSDDERAIKDSLRSCVSAMEAVIKEFGHDDEIGNATKNLRDAKIWGNDDIVKEGNAIFNTMHRLYPDLRHGSTKSSNLTLNEAEYWIGRILNYIQYMDKQQNLVRKNLADKVF